MSDKPVRHVVILGGGSAGWLTAGVLAADHRSNEANGLRITLVESPNIAPLGVGEGTWPSMRLTLKRMGVSETEFFRECDASFKQGIKFSGWVDGSRNDYYYHPLELPRGFNQIDIVLPWQKVREQISFGDATCFQNYLCDKGVAPKQLKTPEYASVANYAYHFSSEKLSQFLTKHCTEKLGVKHVLDDVLNVKSSDDGDIAALQTKANGHIEGDLFIDCSGARALLLGDHYRIPYISKKDVIFNDSALVAQVPYSSDSCPIASHTLATAQRSGWIWDIGLPSRRGVGHVYSSSYTDEVSASEELSEYLKKTIPQEKIEQLSFRKISFEPGYRAKYWYRNCVAVGMSAGFVEPLEATALVMIEASARMISAELPANREVMEIVAERFNKRFSYYWDTTIDFLKLQYFLTKRRDTPYWTDCARPESVPESLKKLLHLWSCQPPNQYDFPLAEEMLPAASWQYILYGMGFVTTQRATETRQSDVDAFDRCMKKVKEIAAHYIPNLPSNRDLINDIKRYGFPKA